MNDKTSPSDPDLEIIKKDLLKIDKKIADYQIYQIPRSQILDKLDAYQKSLPKGSDIGALIDEISIEIKITSMKKSVPGKIFSAFNQSVPRITPSQENGLSNY